MLITKADGRQEEFSEQKLVTSIKRAGIPENLQEATLEHVKEKLYQGIATSEIYHHITEYLEKSEQPYATSRYRIKEALQDLGPTGYPFEDYVARLLQEMGYTTETRVVMQGKCVRHEIDVVATKDNEKIMVEAKFHNTNSVKTDVQVAMYTWARLQDIQHNGFSKAMLVTNTKLTTDAIAYGECMKMQLLGWSYPEGESLRDLVEKYKLLPITSLSTLSNAHKIQLLNSGVTLCKDICQDQNKLDTLSLPDDQKEHAVKEALFVCQLT